MFGMLGGSNTLYGSAHDPEKERAAPPLPIPISFPDTVQTDRSDYTTWTKDNCPDLFEHYATIRRPNDITCAHWEALNIRFVAIANLETIFPDSSLLPDKSWHETPEPNSASPTGNQQNESRVLSNGRPYPTQKDYLVRSNELQYENRDAFQALTRRGAVPGARLAHFRKFWEGLDNMSSYWDTTADEYIPPRPSEDGDEDSNTTVNSADESAEDQEMEDIPSDPKAEDVPIDDKTKGLIREDSRTDLKRRRVAILQQGEENHDEKPNSPVPKSTSHPISNAISSSSSATAYTQPPKIPFPNHPHSLSKILAPPVPKGTYRGHRISNGAGMPELHRHDTVRSFVEPIAWSFGFTLAQSRKPTALAIGKLLIPLKLTSVAWRPPTSREQARAGWLVGPVLGISCRGETGFTEGDSEGVVDVLREVGTLLLLAQERGREGRVEVKPGERQWWTQVPRWGGGMGEDPDGSSSSSSGAGKVGKAPMSSSERMSNMLDELNPDKSSERRGRARGQSHPSRKKKPTAINTWKILKHGVGYWDPRVEYKRIGAEGEDFDEVFLISSLNHHISILRLTVHKAYLEYIQYGSFPSPSSQPEWCKPVVHRSPWYDLFDIKDRLEAMRGIWGVMAYLARPTRSTPAKV
ncbi:hypothetical protein EJ08DRAFT_654616 [Tothia fuscella]|uniref:Uncharacterized protein n=1 Tax=Tothia fuscella TaxID=1048955 RepID=A0A9P4NEL2_9PEZI|nr:hypothetical protein EJ08DRAFT_654616 [Tothia fuscella]